VQHLFFEIRTIYITRFVWFLTKLYGKTVNESAFAVIYGQNKMGPNVHKKLNVPPYFWGDILFKILKLTFFLPKRWFVKSAPGWLRRSAAPEMTTTASRSAQPGGSMLQNYRPRFYCCNIGLIPASTTSFASSCKVWSPFNNSFASCSSYSSVQIVWPKFRRVFNFLVSFSCEKALSPFPKNIHSEAKRIGIARWYIFKPKIPLWRGLGSGIVSACQRGDWSYG
jgi:hypothetical protein